MPMVRYRFRPYFYPRPPHGGRHESSSEGGGQSNFYPRPPHGGRLTITGRYWQTSEFLSTPSARRATDKAVFVFLLALISIHALREEGDCGGCFRHLDLLISIHALREEGDLRLNPGPDTVRISIHALREEGDA